MDGFRSYLTAEGQLAPTQEAAGRGFTQVTVPYKKADLLAFVNELMQQARQRGAQEVRDRLPSSRRPEPADPTGDSVAIRTLARLDGGEQVDAVCELICEADGYPLARFARSVAIAFTRLGGGQ